MANPIFVPALVVGVPVASPPGTAVISGSVVYQYVEKTATYTASDTDKTIHATSGTFTITLPTAVGITGREYVIKNTGAGMVTVACTGGETIDGVSTFILSFGVNPTDSSCVSVLSTGANWIITSKSKP